MHQPGIEPEALAWKASMLPLHHWCFNLVSLYINIKKSLNGF